MTVLVQVAPFAGACTRAGGTISADPDFARVLRSTAPVRADAKCTCDDLYSDMVSNNDRVPGSPQLPPPKTKETKRVKRTTEGPE